ncbi:tyrosine-protein phosphatase [Sphingobacterium chuzhouense]|uniref:protein-tyrosine-phosphatase n=1 Tax=Sphingobacterium chuzhouense TaxID=1742264 RepID=A0ABR7XXN1_9SPHI|nr:CpsB/CapC family capsule biosynthesis tyrosine phosphatase [Sphingobacterium chuzhouense]MBD1423810.1 histidinol phosphatase [Sphingobacterium chuzhouense]
MWTIFNRKRQYPDLQWMYADIHSHILPGIDDGCENVEQSVALLQRLEALGLKKFYFTPHIIQDMYPNTSETISNAFDRLRQKGVEQLAAGYAAEYMVDTAFDQHFAVNPRNLLCLPGGHVLIEMSYMEESKLIEKIAFDLQMEGYIPILAHPERYLFYQRDPKKIERFQDIGCLLQLNLLSLMGYYGRNERRVAKYLLENGMISLVGTDVHHERHVRALEIGILQEDVRAYFKHCTILNEELFSGVTT